MHPSLFPCHKADTKVITITDRKAKWKPGGGGEWQGGRWGEINIFKETPDLGQLSSVSVSLLQNYTKVKTITDHKIK